MHRSQWRRLLLERLDPGRDRPQSPRRRIGSPTGIEVYGFNGVPAFAGTICDTPKTSARTRQPVRASFLRPITLPTAPWTPVGIQPTGADGQNQVLNIQRFKDSATIPNLWLAAAVNGGGVVKATVATTGTGPFTTITSDPPIRRAHSAGRGAVRWELRARRPITTSSASRISPVSSRVTSFPRSRVPAHGRR